MLKSFKCLALFALIAMALIGCQKTPSQNQRIIKINKAELKIEVAASAAEITQGLSGRENLCQNCGMLFKFSDYQIRNFWMKDMNFSLDILWIKDQQIVGIEANVPLLTDGRISTVQSKEEVNRVLEVNSGWTNSHNVKIGDKIMGLD